MKYLFCLLINIYVVFCNEPTGKMEAHGVVPDVIDDAPPKILDVSFTLKVFNTVIFSYDNI